MSQQGSFVGLAMWLAWV